MMVPSGSGGAFFIDSTDRVVTDRPTRNRIMIAPFPVPPFGSTCALLPTRKQLSIV